MSKKKSTEDFIHDAMLIHGDRYDYSIVDIKKIKEIINAFIQQIQQ